LASAVDSVLRQSFDDWELLIIDDGSTDNTAEILQRYDGHPSISIHSLTGIGLPAVCNYALKKAQGEYLIRLDGDDVFDENILLILVNFLDRHSNAALVFTDNYLIDEFGDIYAHQQRRRIYDQNHMLDMPPNGACTLIRKSVLDEIGGYREDLGAQDGFDLWSRVRDRYGAGNVSLPLFYYRRHGENLTENNKRIFSARRQIKKDAIWEKLVTHRPIIAVIPCRRNYDFRKDLWSVEINGRTLLERDIETCLASVFIDRIVVTCDNPDAESVVRSFDDHRVEFFLRDPKSTIRTSSIVPTLREIVQLHDPQLNGITVLRYIQTPFVTTDVLDEAVTSLVMNDADSSWGVEPIKRKLFRRRKNGLELISNDGVISSDFDVIFGDSQTFSAVRNRNLMRGTLTGSSVVCFEVSAIESFFINSEQDIEVATVLAKRND
jgi:glycosyltransferase involved in cell wall biosynthesis